MKIKKILFALFAFVLIGTTRVMAVTPVVQAYYVDYDADHGCYIVFIVLTTPPPDNTYICSDKVRICPGCMTYNTVDYLHDPDPNSQLQSTVANDLEARAAFEAKLVELQNEYYPPTAPQHINTGIGLNIEGSNNIVVYPNPVVDKLEIGGVNSSTEVVKIRITDISGKVVNETILSSDVPNDIDLKDFANGVYPYTVFRGEAIIKRGKFVKM